jgi:tetratricopeptide (TPR) repeat protein
MSRAWWALPLVVTAFAFRQVVGHGLVQDADFLIVQNHLLDGLGQLWPNVTHDYFWSSSGNRIPYWRPAVKASWVVEVALFGRRAPGFHLVQLGWHLLATGGVMALGRALGAGRAAALAAGLLFGLHPAAIEPVCLVMARSDVMSAAAGVWSLWAWQRWRTLAARGQSLPSDSIHGLLDSWSWLHVLALTVALGSKEVAVVLAPVVTVWALLRREPRAALPAWGLTAVYLVARALVLRDIAAVHGQLTLARLAVAGGSYLGGLIPFRLTTGVRNIGHAELSDARLWLAALVAWLALLALTAVLARGRRWREVGLVGWLVAMLAPVLLVAAIPVPGIEDKFALADRWLYPSVAAASLLVAFLAGRGLLPATAVWAALMLVRSAPDRAAYASEDSLQAAAEAQYQATPPGRRTAEDRCLHDERLATAALDRGDPAGALAVLTCRDRPAAGLLELEALVSARRFPEALPRARALLARKDVEARYAAQVHLLVGQTFLETGDRARAEDYLRRAAALGSASCNLPALQGKAAALSGRLAEAATDYERAAACSGGARALIAAGQLWLAAGKTGEARRVVRTLGGLPMSGEERALYQGLHDAVVR